MTYKSSAAGLSLLLAACSLLSCSGKPLRWHYRLRTKWVRNYVVNQVADINGDGVDELIRTHPFPHKQIDVNSPDLQDYYCSFKFDFISDHYVTAVPGSCEDSLRFLVSIPGRDTITYKLLQPTPLTRGRSISDKRLLTLLSIGHKQKNRLTAVSSDSAGDMMAFFRHPDALPNDFSQSMNYVTDFKDRTERNLALFTLNTSWDKYGKRGVAAADLSTGRVVWTWFYGSQNSSIVTENIDGKPGDEIIISTYASNNGVFVNETGDDSSYVMVLSGDGSLLWRRSIGGYWTGASFESGRFSAAGKKQLVVYPYILHDAPVASNRLLKIDAYSGSILESRLTEYRVCSARGQLPVKADYNGDSMDECAIGFADGYVRMLDGFLNTVRQSRPYKKPIQVLASSDLDRDGIPEIAAYIRDGALYVLDNNLNELCRYEDLDNGVSTCRIVRGKNKNYLLVCSNAADFRVTRLLELEKSLFPFPDTEKGRAPYVWIILSAVCIAWGYAMYKNRKTNALATMARLHRALSVGKEVLVLDRSQRIQFMGDMWAKACGVDGVSFNGRTLHDVCSGRSAEVLGVKVMEAVQDGLYKQEVSLVLQNDAASVLYELRMHYIPSVKFYVFTLKDKTQEQHIRMVEEWAVIAQELAHGIKTPLASLRWDIQEQRDNLQGLDAETQQKMGKCNETMMEQVDRLIRMSDGFMRFVKFEQPVLKPVDINKLASDMVLDLHTHCASYITIEWDLDHSVPRALIDKKQFATAFTNIFSNAVESIQGRGSIRVSTRFVQLFQNNRHTNNGNRFVELVVHDTGRGIPPKHMSSITQPFFTLKDTGTGIGLSIVKKIMESHGGSIIITSEPGTGTAASMRFRADIT